MPLIDLNKSTSNQPLVIPDEIARDTEVASAIAAHVGASDPHPQYLIQGEGDLRYPIAEPRSGDTVINANSVFFGNFYRTKWIDGSQANLNFPSNSGLLKQTDSLIGTPVEGLYVSQEYEVNNTFWKRTRTNGIWNPWAQLWTTVQGTPVWQTPSDKRFKNSVRLIKSGLEVLMGATPVGFRYTAEIRKQELFGDLQTRCKRHYGFMAQDFPIDDLVFEKEGDKGIDYVEIIPFLVKAIQELQEQIDGLKLKLQEK